MPADGAGIRFGQYVLLRRIARGGMAEVFLAQQRGLEGFDRRVAVKRILPHLADAPDFIKMFLGEAKLAAQLSHPNVVHIYDFGKVDHDYFIAMEFVDGVHAGQLFKHSDKERVPPTLIARLGADAAAALNYAHELRATDGRLYGLVHRDVSPANIMVSYDGVVKLCDFGIAKAARLGDQLTNPGQVKGKYAYMSPEQTIAAPLDGRSDVYSLAIVMWELLAGKTIVPRGDAVEAMRAIRDGRLMPLEKAAPWTPPPLAKAIGWALQTKREHRATAAELAQELEAFIKSSPELATPMQLGAWVRGRFPREHTSQIPTVTPPGGGTAMAPGTVAAAGTGTQNSAGGTRIAPLTPDPERSGLIAASVMGTDTASETIGMVNDRASAPTLIDDGARAAFDPTDPPFPTVVLKRVAADAEPSGGETMIVPQSRQLHAAPLARPAAPSGPAPLPPIFDSRPMQRRSEPPMFTETTLGVPKRRPRARIAFAIAGLVALAIVSFVIALAARTHGRTPAIEDAGVIVQAPPDAAVVTPPADAAIADDAAEPTTDAGPAATALLEIRTKPTGALVRIGDQARTATAQFALPAGHHVIVCELDGWQPERREADLLRGEHIVQEIVFTHRVPVRPTQPLGKLSVRTTPYSEVYIGTRKLNETPFEEDLAAGTYTLVFKNPEHQTVIKKITIVAGKTTKLQFNLP